MRTHSRTPTPVLEGAGKRSAERFSNSTTIDHGDYWLDLSLGRNHFFRVHRNCGVEPRLGHRRVLRGRAGHPDRREWHGRRGRLDECGELHLDGRARFFHGIRRVRLPHGVDGRVRATRPLAGSVSAEVWGVHGPRLRRKAVLLGHGPRRGGHCGHLRLLHLRGRANARGWGGL